MPEEAKKKPEVDPARTVNVSFPGNSNKDKAAAAGEIPKIQPIEGMVVRTQKPSMAKRMREAFTGEDATSIGEYLLLQVAIPTIKNMIYDLITGGANRALFGNTIQNQNGANVRNPGKVNYSQISRNQVNNTPTMSQQDKATHNFSNVVFSTRQEAELVLSLLMDRIAKYNLATVTDLYEAVNITGSFADDRYGWFELNGADIRPARGGGFYLDLPATQPIR